MSRYWERGKYIPLHILKDTYIYLSIFLDSLWEEEKNVHSHTPKYCGQCVFIAFILCLYCSYSMLMFSLCSVNVGFILCLCCNYIVFILWSYYVYVVLCCFLSHVLNSYCVHVVFIMWFFDNAIYCANAVLTLFHCWDLAHVRFMLTSCCYHVWHLWCFLLLLLFGSDILSFFLSFIFLYQEHLSQYYTDKIITILPNSAKPQFSSTGLSLDLILIYPASARPAACRE